MKLECPKCGSQAAWYEKTTYDVSLICICGYRRVVFSSILEKLEGPLCESIDSGDEVKLPRFGSNLHQTIMVLSILPEGSSKEITERLNELRGASEGSNDYLTVSDVSSYLTILRSKGLVDRVDIRRGVAGGSTWTLTDIAEDLISVART